MKTKLIEFPLFPLEQTTNPVLPIDNAIGSTAETEPPPALATDEETAVSKTAKPSQPKVRTEKNSTEGIVKEEVEAIAANQKSDCSVQPQFFQLSKGNTKDDALNLQTVEKIMGTMGDYAGRRKFEEGFLAYICTQLSNAEEIIAKRRGIVLLSIKAIAPHGEFDAAARIVYPSLSERTRSHNMLIARNFIRMVEPTFPKDASPDDYLKFETKWLLSKIVEYHRPTTAPTKTAKLTVGTNMAGPNTADTNQTATNTTEAVVLSVEKKLPSTFLRSETFKRHIKEFADAYAKVKTSIKRISPETLEETDALLEKHVPEELHSLVKMSVEERKNKLTVSTKGVET